MSEKDSVVIEEFPEVSKTSGKRYRLEEADNGDILRVYETGTVLNDENGKIVEGSKDHRITSENTADYRARNEEKKVNAVARAIADKHGSVELGLEHLAKRAVKRANGSGHVANAAFESLLKHYAPTVVAGASVPPGGVRVDIGSEVARKILGTIAQIRSEGVKD